MNRRTHITHLLLAAAIASALIASLAHGQRYQSPPLMVESSEKLPEKFKDVGITQNLDAQLPLDAEFVDSKGRAVTLGEYFNNDKPVIIVLIYFRCPSLCGIVLNSTLKSLQDVPATAGEDFEIVVIGFDHREGPYLAEQKRIGYLAEYNRKGAEKSWHFLTGDAENIARVCETIGFKFKWHEPTKEYIHDAAIYVATPEGRLSRYLFPMGFSDPKTVRLALTEASSGKVGSLVDVLTWRCSHYDPATGTYAASVMKIVKLASIVVGLGGLFSLFAGITLVKMIKHHPPAREAAADTQESGK